MAVLKQSPSLAVRSLVAIGEGRAAVRDGRLRELRLRAGISQRELAAAVGVRSATVSRWESGIRRVPHAREAERLAAVLRLLEAAVD